MMQVTTGANSNRKNTDSSLCLEELQSYCSGKCREILPGQPLEYGKDGVVVFDKALMRPRIFVCEDIGDSVILEAVVMGHPSAAYVSQLEPLSAPKRVPGRATVAITHCTSADLDSIVSIDKKQWGEWANTQPLYRQLLEITPSTVKVARDLRGNVVGFAVGLLNQEQGHALVLSVDVHQDYRGLGIGKLLVEELLASFAEARCNKITAIISPGNLGSIALFESFGFKANEILKNYFGFGQTQVRYVKNSPIFKQKKEEAPTGRFQ